MSEHIARQALTRMHMREVAVAANLTTLAADLRQMAVADPAKEQASLLARREELCAAFGLNVGVQSKPFAFSQGVAVIPVTGSLINRFGSSYGWITGYVTSRYVNMFPDGAEKVPVMVRLRCGAATEASVSV